jgi:hypothetical protein
MKNFCVAGCTTKAAVSDVEKIKDLAAERSWMQSSSHPDAFRALASVESACRTPFDDDPAAAPHGIGGGLASP